MHWAEDSISSSTLRERFEAFLDYRIGSVCNISWPDFLKQPSWMNDWIIEVLKNRKPEDDGFSALQKVLESQNGKK